MEIFGLIALLAVMWIVSSVGAAFQLRHYRQTLRDLQSEYGDGFLGVGMSKSNFKPKKIVLIVANNQGIVIESLIMSGITIFAKFKQLNQFLGEDINSINESEVDKGLKNPFFQAVNYIKEEMDKQVN